MSTKLKDGISTTLAVLTAASLTVGAVAMISVHW
jgi:hypothetical protein